MLKRDKNKIFGKNHAKVGCIIQVIQWIPETADNLEQYIYIYMVYLCVCVVFVCYMDDVRIHNSTQKVDNNHVLKVLRWLENVGEYNE